MTLLSHRQVKLLQSFVDSHDYSFRNDYSGRGMYGNQCIGFIIDQSQSLFSFGIDLAVFLTEKDEWDFLNDLQSASVKTDSMGLGTIVYFPRLAISPVADYDDEEEQTRRDEKHGLYAGAIDPAN